MNDILQWPVDAYDWVYTEFGFIGVLVAALLLVLFVLAVFFWLDRRK